VCSGPRLCPEVDREAERDVSGWLMALVQKDLVRPDRAILPGEDAFRFRHLLIRDAAHEALATADRAQLHECFADGPRSAAPAWWSWTRPQATTWNRRSVTGASLARRTKRPGGCPRTRQLTSTWQAGV
jgi:hypothetical protein